MASKNPEYTTLYSPDGKHSQKVGSTVREKELRFAGWTDKNPATTPQAAPTKTTARTDTPKETAK